MNYKFEVEVRYKASIGKVWTAITDRDQLRQWFFDVSDFKPQTGFKFGFSIANMYHHMCTVTEVLSLRSLSYTWQYEGFDGASHVTFTLNDEGESTRLKLTHDDLQNHEDFLSAHPDFPRESYAAGWTPLIKTNLKNLVEKA